MRKIAIIGSGIAGLVLGNFLREFNLNFKIFEIKKEINPHGGYGIQLSTNSIKILNKIGFNNFDKDKFFNPKKVCFKSLSNQKLISEININTFNNENELYTCLRRPSLLKFLSKDLSEFIEFDKYVTNLEHFENKIKINFRDGSSENFDFLVIATGMDADTKKFVCENNTNPHYSGSIAIRATFKDDLKIIDKEKIIPVIRVTGEIDVYTCPKLNTAISSVIERGHHDVVLNLEAIKYIDSTGLGTIAYNAKQMEAHQGTLFVVCAQPQIRKIFDISGLDKKNIQLFDSETPIWQLPKFVKES